MSTKVQENMMMVKLSEIKEDFNPRTDFSSVEELAKSIASVGLLQPMVVIASKDGYSLVDGACRLRALKKLDQKETQVIVIDTKSADEAQMAANLMRADLNVLERARGYERMIRLFPAKYNVSGVAKTFGESKKSVERLVSVAKRIPANFDGKLAMILSNIKFEELELLAQIPNDGTMDKVIEAISVQDPDVWQALGKKAERLDYSCDALTTGKLVSAGRAFIVKSGERETAWTTDKQAFKEAKESYEAKQKKQYGSEDKAGREKIVEKTEKQKAADREVMKKEKEAQKKAVSELPGLFKKFVMDLASQEDIDALGREVCEKHLDSDKCRRLWTAFNVPGYDKVSSYELRSKTWEKVFAPTIKTAQQVAKLRTFFSLGWKDGKSPEQAWVKGMKKYDA